jgi:NADPH:quinone reductase-like Zn-dependent oxidoreductase
MTTMQALVAYEVGEPAHVLRLERRPIPTPNKCQVRIRIQAAPIHPSDLHMLRGRFGVVPPLPAVMGSESVGIVDALGEKVDDLRVGQRVITIGVRGTWQEFVVVDAKSVLAVPKVLSTSTAAQMITNPLTALLLVTNRLHVRADEWLLQTAAGSTVGRMVLQLGAHLGFKTINVVRRRTAVEEILGLGGNEVICTEDEEVGKRVLEIAGPAGVSKAIDCVAGQLGADVSRCLAPGGRMVVYGALSTHRQTEADKLILPIFSRSIIYEAKIVQGFFLPLWFATESQAQIRTAIETTFELVCSGVLRISEGRSLSFGQFAEAVALAEAPGHGAKPLFIPES